MEASDWDPLPPERLGLHPGEDLQPGRQAAHDRPSAPEGHGPGDAPAGRRPRRSGLPPAELEPAQLRALAALQSKLRSAPKASTLVGELVDREHRRRRRRRAAQASDLAALAPAKCELTAADIPLAVEFASGAEGHDPREDEDWFRRLPGAERDRLRDQWTSQRLQLSSSGTVQRRNRGRRAATALIVFAATCVLGTPAAWPVTAAAGVLCAIIWSYVGACRYRDPIVALACFYAVNLVAWAGNGADGLPPGSFIDAILLAALAAVTGFDAEIRRSGGFDDCR